MRLVFAGTPEIASTVLAKLCTTEHEIVAVLTQPDRPAGRGQKLHESTVKQLAKQQGFIILQPKSLKTPEIFTELQALQADLMIVVAYGLLIPQTILDLPKFGCWNIHVSLLPRWRGAAPIQRALEAGDERTGVSIMQMDAGLDTGPILLQKIIQILPDDTAQSLHDRLADLGADTLLTALTMLEQNKLKALPQTEHDVTHAKKLTKEESRLDLSLSADALARKVRAFDPWPMASLTYNDEILKLGKVSVSDHENHGHVGEIVDVNPEFILVQTGKGRLRIEALQKAGGKMLSIREFLNGHKDFFVVGSELT
jgi:methionyl-tRNA formyltransferase